MKTSIDHMIFKQLILTTILAMAFLAVFAQETPATSVANETETQQNPVQIQPSKKATAAQQQAKATVMQFGDAIRNWPEAQQKVGRELNKKYGEPSEITETRMVWNNNGPWKRTILYKETQRHNFPVMHSDFLEQTVDYRVLTDKYDEVARYDGSILMDRTRGELSVRCENEASNLIAVNVAHEVFSGKRSVTEAREFMAKTVNAHKKGEVQPYAQRLQFTVIKGATADPDKAFEESKAERSEVLEEK
jgi:hypothetical protein